VHESTVHSHANQPSDNTAPTVAGLRRVLRLLTIRRADRTYHDPLFADPDRVENDYHRFRNHPGVG
jgi:hypothetical protein